MSVTSRLKQICGSRGQSGGSFTENLIAVLVLSVGLLGVASMSIGGFKHNHNALLRSQAAMLATDIIERMRANSIQANSGAYNINLTASAPGASDCLAGNCDPTQLASFDLNQWLSELAARLPGGDGSVAVTPPTATITVTWSESGGSTSQVVVSSQL